MPTIGSGSVQAQTGLVTFTQSPAPSGTLSSFTLQTPTAGINLFSNYSNTGGNVTLVLCSVAAGPGIALTVNQGVIYISASSGSYAPLDTTGVVPWANLPVELQSLPISFVIPGQPPESQIYNVVLPFACSVPANLVGTVVYDGTQATAAAVFTINKITNGVTGAIGTVTITPTSNTSCTLSTQPFSTFMPGDVIQLVAPSAPDSTLADIAITILARKT